MCLILFSYQPIVHGARAAADGFRLVVAANRDERHDRPTQPLAPWADTPDIIAGRDLEQGGTWMGLSRGGRFAAVTNYREGLPKLAPLSRGALVAEFLRGSAAADTYAHEIHARGTRYNGFGLLVDDGDALWFVSNRAPAPVPVAPGVHGLSNHLLDSPWPKVVACTQALEHALAQPREQWNAALFALLAMRELPVAASLSDTGAGAARERVLAPAFIVGQDYGTRSSTVLLRPHTGAAEISERTFLTGGLRSGTVDHRVPLAAAQR